MNKFLILAICLAVFLSGCDSELLHQYVDRLDTDRSESIGDSKIEGSEKAKETSWLETTIELESGIYAIPFGATTEEIAKWCADNNMAIANPTEKDVKEAARNAVRRVIELKEAYDFEIASLTPLEQQLLKLYSDTDDVFEQAKVAAAKEKVDLLKNATISYEGRKYYLERVHDGMKVNVDNQERFCTDDLITKTAYRLILTPTEKSEKMMNAGLKILDVFFYGDIGQDLRAYATHAIFGPTAERSTDNQLGLVLSAICEKHGSPALMAPGLGSTKDWKLWHELDDGDMYHLFGPKCGYRGATGAGWARNLLLYGQFCGIVGSSEIVFEGSDFRLFYYDHNVVARLREFHSKALQDFEKQYHEKKKKDLTQMKQDF
jgi:hypothetical protein